MAMNQEDYMRAAGRRRRGALEAAAGLLHARHAALHRGGRRDAEGQRDLDGGQEAARRERLQGRAGGLRGRAGPDRSPRPRATSRRICCKRIGMNVDFVATDWGTAGSAARRRTRRPRAAGTCSTPGTRAPTASIRPPTPPSAPTATRPGSAGRTTRSVETGRRRLVRRAEPRGGEGRDRRAEQGRDGLRGLCADRLLPRPTRRGARTSAGVVKGPLPFCLGRVRER